MVNYIEKEIWRCPYCEKEHDTWEVAVECAEECANIDYPTQDNKSAFECEYCKKKFDDEAEAEGCEEVHTQNNDKFYNLVILEKASKHPDQMQLMEVQNR